MRRIGWARVTGWVAVTLVAIGLVLPLAPAAAAGVVLGSAAAAAALAQRPTGPAVRPLVVDLRDRTAERRAAAASAALSRRRRP